MNFLAWILFGLIAGFIANAIDPNPNKGGILGTIVLGILGALVGGFLGNLLFGVNIAGFDLQSFVLAIVGSLILLGLERALTSRTKLDI